MSKINVRNVAKLQTMVVVTLVTCQREMQTGPIQELIAVKEYLLVDDLERQLMVLHIARRPNLKWKVR